MNITNWKQQAQDAGVEASDIMGKLMNSFSEEGGDAFIKRMSCEHRTLQQNFTRLMFRWLEHIASDEYRTDGRNESSKEISKRLLEGFIKQTAIDCKLPEEDVRKMDFYAKPSKWLPNV